jgi:hypothetical protein
MVLSQTLRGTVFRTGLFGAALLSLAACGTFGGSSGKESACPITGVLDKAGTLTRFAEGGRDGADATLQVAVADIGTNCTYNEKAGQVKVELKINFRAERGPAGRAPTDRFTYFIAVADPGGNVTARETFDKSVEFPGGANAIATVDELSTTIPLDRGQRIEDFRLYVALQLSAAELEYNRAYRGR